MSPVVRAAQRRLRRTLSKARDAIVGRAVEPTIETIARFDHRWPVFSSAVEFVATEEIAGDIVECGVFTGMSLALFSYAHQRREPATPRRIVGFDAFEGLPPSAAGDRRACDAGRDAPAVCALRLAGAED